jgi:hypothetical protein
VVHRIPGKDARYAYYGQKLGEGLFLDEDGGNSHTVALDAPLILWNPSRALYLSKVGPRF